MGLIVMLGVYYWNSGPKPNSVLLTLPDSVHALTWGVQWVFSGMALDLAGEAFDGQMLMVYGGPPDTQRAELPIEK